MEVSIVTHLSIEGKEAKKVELPSIEAIKKCVLLGLRRSMLPHFSVKEEIDRGRLDRRKKNSES